MVEKAPETEKALHENRSFNDDFVFKIAFILANQLFNVALYSVVSGDKPMGYFAAMIVPAILQFWYCRVLKQTAFIQDIQEFLIIDVLVNGLFAFFYIFFHDTIYQDAKPIWLCYIKVMCVIIAVRGFWFFKEVDTDEYRNWPVCGPIGMVNKFILKKEWRKAKPTKGQAIGGYLAIILAIFGGIGFFLLAVKSDRIFAHVASGLALLIIIKTAPLKAKAFWHPVVLERVEMARENIAIKVKAKIYQEKASKAANDAEAARAAALAAHELAEKERSERDRIAREADETRDELLAHGAIDFLRHMQAREAQKAAQESAASLQEELAAVKAKLAAVLKPAQLTLLDDTMNPVLVRLDRNSQHFDPGFYITHHVMLARTKYKGKSKAHAFQALYTEFTPLAIELGLVKSKLVVAGEPPQPNKTLLEACIHAGLVGFGADD